MKYFKSLIKKIYFQLWKLLYTNQSTQGIPDWLNNKKLPRALLFYNAFGCYLFAMKQRIALYSKNKFFNKEILLDGFDSISYSSLYKNGRPDILWPRSYLFEQPVNINKSKHLFLRLKKSYDLSYSLDSKQLPQSKWWQDLIVEFKDAFFSDGNIDESMLIDFRRKYTSRAIILSDQLKIISDDRSYNDSYKKAIQLVQSYHKMSNYIDHGILHSASESQIGNNRCPVYRGQRLSGRILTHSYYLSQLKRNTEFKLDDPFVVLDLGGAYGGLSRLISSYYSKSKIILIELPEVCMMAGYFLSQSLPDKKIKMLSDINLDALQNQSYESFDFDILILPTWAIAHLANQSVDLFINTTSLGEVTKEYGDFYMTNIERIVSKYFYSVNGTKGAAKKFDDFGYFNWPFTRTWRTILYKASTNERLEWLGKVIPDA